MALAGDVPALAQGPLAPGVLAARRDAAQARLLARQPRAVARLRPKERAAAPAHAHDPHCRRQLGQLRREQPPEAPRRRGALRGARGELQRRSAPATRSLTRCVLSLYRQIGGIVRKRIEVLRLHNLRLSNHQNQRQTSGRSPAAHAPAGGYEWQLALGEAARAGAPQRAAPRRVRQPHGRGDPPRLTSTRRPRSSTAVPTLEELVLRNPSAADTGGPSRLDYRRGRRAQRGPALGRRGVPAMYKAHLPPSPTQPKGRVWR